MVITKSLPEGTTYRVHGQGPVCIFLHGFAEDGRVWDEQVNALSSDYTCIVVDIPGTGLSADAFVHHLQLTLDESATLVLQVMDQENINKAVLLGHSMGGYITLSFVEQFADRLQGFGMIHSTAFADNEEKRQNRRRSVTFMKEHGTRLLMEQLYPNLYGEKFKTEHYDLIENQIKASELFQPEVLIQYYEMMMVRPDRTEVLRNAKVPVLFVMGTEDKTVNLTDSLAQCHLPLESHVHILETAGHMGMKEDPENTTAAIRAFLRYVNEN
jgi:pimeloyl-ACP methyl ester carboxylesterase